MVQNTIENGRKSGAPARFDAAWVKILQNHLGAYKHAEFGLGTSTDAGAALRLHPDGQQRDPDQFFLQDALRAGHHALSGARLALDLPGFDFAAGKQHWLEDPIWQGVRKSIESIMGSNDYLEQYFATNVVFEPLRRRAVPLRIPDAGGCGAERFHHPCQSSPRRRRIMSAISPTPSNCSTSLASDPTHGAHNIALFNKWLAKHAELALDAANRLQPIWSQPRVKVATFGDALGHAKNRIRVSRPSLACKVPANLAS